jgi:glutamyl-tRNA synthetase
LPGFTDRPVIRMRVPDSDVPTTFEDMIRGSTNAPTPDDQVILKNDGFPTYHLAVVIDDHEMGISHVLRAEEWVSSMPKQLLLYRFFGWDPPKFAHLPLLRNQDRSKISKRKNPAARLPWFQEEGFLPEALINFLALQGWSMPDGREIFSFDDVVTNFDVERFSPVGPVFDVDKLDWMNGKYIEALSDAEFLRRVDPFLPGPGQEDGLRILAPHLKTRVKRLKEVCDQVEFLYLGELDLDRESMLKQGAASPTALEALMAAESVLGGVSDYSTETVQAALEGEMGRREWKPRPFFMSIRVAISGKTQTPPLFPMLAALGRERSLTRLRDAIDLLAP